MNTPANVVPFPKKARGGLGFLDTTPKAVSYGAKGPDVIALQMNLQTWGFPPGKLDGIYGPNTRAAVAALQQFMGLPSDGIFGPNTLAAVQRDLASETGSRLKTMFEPRPPVVVAAVTPPTSMPVSRPATVPPEPEPVVYAPTPSKLPIILGGLGILALAYLALRAGKATGGAARGAALAGSNYLDEPDVVVQDDDDDGDGEDEDVQDGDETLSQ